MDCICIVLAMIVTLKNNFIYVRPIDERKNIFFPILFHGWKIVKQNYVEKQEKISCVINAYLHPHVPSAKDYTCSYFLYWNGGKKSMEHQLVSFNLFHPEARLSHQFSSVRSGRQPSSPTKAVDLDHIIVNGLFVNLHAKFAKLNKSRPHLHFCWENMDQHGMSCSKKIHLLFETNIQKLWAGKKRHMPSWDTLSMHSVSARCQFWRMASLWGSLVAGAA